MSKGQREAASQVMADSRSLCFLSELPASETWQRCILKLGGIFPAAIFAFFGFVTLLLGHYAQANALRIQFIPVINIDRGIHAAAVEHIFGFLGEPNHGLLVIFFGPVFIWLSIALMKSMSDSFRTLEMAGRLTRSTVGKLPTEVIARWNKIVMRAVGVISVAGFVGLELSELPGALRAVRGQGGDYEIGYVQSPGLSTWEKNFNGEKLKSPEARWGWTEKLYVRDRLTEEIKRWLVEYAPIVVKDWGNYIEFKYPTADPVLQERQISHGDFELRIDDAFRDGKLDISAVTFGGADRDHGVEMAIFWGFLILGLLLEGVFHAFAAYMVIKVLWWLGMVFWCLPGWPERHLHLTPFLEDSSGHYGFYPLHQTYNLIIYLIATGGFLFSLTALNSLSPFGEKTDGINSALGKCGILLGLALAGVAMLGPLILFPWKLSPLRERKSEELYRRIKERPQDAGKLESQLEKIREQRTWPSKDANFRWAALAFITFLAMPWAFLLAHLPFDPNKYLIFARETRNFAHALSRHYFPDADGKPTEIAP